MNSESTILMVPVSAVWRWVLPEESRSSRRAAINTVTCDVPAHRADRPRRHTIDAVTADVPTHREDSPTGGGCTRWGAHARIVTRSVTVGRQVIKDPRKQKAPVK